MRSIVRNETIGVGVGKRFFDGIKKTFTHPYEKKSLDVSRFVFYNIGRNRR